MTADEYTPRKKRFFLLFEVPDLLNGANSSRTPATINDLRGIFARELVLIPTGTNLADLDYLRRRHDLNPKQVMTYNLKDIKSLAIPSDQLIVIRLTDPLQFMMYSGIDPTPEHDPCMM